MEFDYPIDYALYTSDEITIIIKFLDTIEESKNLAGIETLSNQDFPTADFLTEAKRVAKKKVIVKAHFKDDIFEKFDFIRLTRKNTKFHYGYIDTNIEKAKN